MKMMLVRGFIAGALAAQALAAAAQTTVYESKDKAGPVYSDKPSPGAAAVALPPPNVVQGPKIAPVAPPAPVVAAPYRSLAIVSPANEGTVHSNTGAFDLRARSSPTLRPGDRVRVQLDGQWLPSTFGSTRLHVSELDWQAAANASSAEHSLQLAIVDKQGAVLVESAPVRFYVHRASVAGKR